MHIENLEMKAPLAINRLGMKDLKDIWKQNQQR